MLVLEREFKEESMFECVCVEIYYLNTRDK